MTLLYDVKMRFMLPCCEQVFTRNAAVLLPCRTAGLLCLSSGLGLTWLWRACRTCCSSCSTQRSQQQQPQQPTVPQQPSLRLSLGHL
jgi:hypothetical protein